MLEPSLASFAKRALLVIFDGLRPDFISPHSTPRLARFFQRSARFSKSRSVFPSLTRVASSSLATGAPPAIHGMIANSFFCREALVSAPLELSTLSEMRLLERLAGGALTAPTFADVMAANGKRLAIAHGGSAGATFVLAPNAAKQGHWVYSAHGPEGTVTPEAAHEVFERFGPHPSRDLPLVSVVDRVADVVVDHILARISADVIVAWFPEPDTSFHYLGMAAEGSRRVLARCDAQFGRILDTLAERGMLEDTAVFALSDHGHITITEDIPLFDLLTEAGFPTGASVSKGLALIGVAGTVGELRVLDGGPELRDRAVAFLQEQPWIGHIFTQDRNGVDGASPGSFSLKLVRADHRRAPDIAITLRSSNELDPFGFAGCGRSTGEVPLNCGMHGGLHPKELSTLLAFSGPGVIPGCTVNAPAGLIDIAPTLLAFLGMRPPRTMTGRVLTEAFGGVAGRAEASEYAAEKGAYRQTIAIDRLQQRSYIREGWSVTV